MNALAMTPTNPLNTLLAMSVAPSGNQASGNFPGLANLIFDSPAPNTPDTTSAPVQKIADALIRSMMSGPPVLQNAIAPQAKAAIRSSIPGGAQANHPTSLCNNDAAEPQTPARLVNDPSNSGLNPATKESTAAPDVNNAPALLSTQIKAGAQTSAPTPVTGTMPKLKAEIVVAAVKTNAPVRVQESGIKPKPANASPAFDGQVDSESIKGATAAQDSLDPSITVPIMPAAQPVTPELKETTDSVAAEIDPYGAGSKQDVERSQTPSDAKTGVRFGSQAQNKRAASSAAGSSPAKTGSPAALPLETSQEPKFVLRDDSLAQMSYVQATPDPAGMRALPAPVVRTTVVPPILPDLSVAAETSAAADSGSTNSPQTAPVSTFGAGAAVPTPVAFSAILSPISDFSPATASSLQSAAKETAPAELPFSFAALSEKPAVMTPSGEENATPVNAAKNDNSPAPAPKSRAEQSEEQSKDASVPVTPTDAAPQSDDVAQSATVILPEKPAPPETTHASSSTPASSDVAQTLRSSEPPVAAPAPTPSAPLQQIALRIPQAGGAPVDLQLTERGGEIHVSVRTADTAMQTSLREDLGTLSNSLERAGYRAEMFTPREVSVALPAREMQTSTNLRDDREQSGSGGRNGSGNPQQGRQQQSSRDQRQKNWLEELENSK